METANRYLDFLDVRRHGFVRVAVCVPEGRVADPAFNTAAHLKLLASVHQAGAHYALCPELGLTAYSCGDLFFQESLLRAAREALQAVAAASASWNTMSARASSRAARTVIRSGAPGPAPTR